MENSVLGKILIQLVHSEVSQSRQQQDVRRLSVVSSSQGKFFDQFCDAFQMYQQLSFFASVQDHARDKLSKILN